jgi:hypothetical protein
MEGTLQSCSAVWRAHYRAAVLYGGHTIELQCCMDRAAVLYGGHTIELQYGGHTIELQLTYSASSKLIEGTKFLFIK